MQADEAKVALVTGAARGIGLATVRLFRAQGWAVVLADWDQETLARAVAELEAEGDGAAVLGQVCDVSDPESVAALAAVLRQRFRRLDALVNNAGVAEFGPLEDCNFSMWKRVMSTNLDGPFLCTQALLPELKASRGAIVNIGSISGFRASTLRVAYGTSKAALIHLTKQQAAELGEFGVRANCVCPGPVRTKLSMAVHTPEIIAAYHDALPLNRYGSEEEIGEVIVFLCSAKASFVTGQIIGVDGGFESTGVGLPALRA